MSDVEVDLQAGPATDAAPEEPATRRTLPAALSKGGTRLLSALAGKWRVAPILLSIVLLWIFFWTQNSVFLSAENLTYLAVQIVVTAIVGLGLFFVLVIGEIDLAIANLSAVSAAAAASLAVHHDVKYGFALIAAIAVGAVIGAGQGAIVVAFRAPSFIVTLGVSLALVGVLLEILGTTGSISLIGQPLAKLATTYLPTAVGWAFVAAAVALLALVKVDSYIARRRHGLKCNIRQQVLLPTVAAGSLGAVIVVVFDRYHGVPTPVAILFGLLIGCSYLATQTQFGLYLYAIGTNVEAARRAGIPISRIRILAFTLAGGIAAIGGIIAGGRVLAVASEAANPTLLLEAIAAAVIGGVSLFGGRGTVWAPLLGALVIGSISNGMLLMDASTQSRLEVEGGILVLAVCVDAFIARIGRAGLG